LPQIYFDRLWKFRVIRDHRDSVHVIITTDKQRTVAVKRLRDDCNLILTKYFLAPHHRIQRPEARVIKRYRRGRNPLSDERFSHLRGFIVVSGAVIPAENKMINLAHGIQGGRHFNSLLKKRIRATSDGSVARTQYECHPVVRQLRKIGENEVARTPDDPHIAGENDGKQ